MSVEGLDTVIVDSHAHAWRRWPYQPSVPDPQSRGMVEQLLWEMDANGVDQALLVCARIGGNPDNNDYGAAAAAHHADRLVCAADVDCSWTATYHRSGAADRLRAAAERHGLVAFTHYLRDVNDGWLTSQDGLAFFAAASELNLIASVAAAPCWHADVREVARRFPMLPILLHHLGGLSAAREAGDQVHSELLACAGVTNILVKVSGFHYASERGWDYPYHDVRRAVHTIAEAFGPRRLCWGSDYPAARALLTYRQSMEVVRTHCDFLSASALEWIMGRTLHEVLHTRRPIE